MKTRRTITLQAVIALLLLLGMASSVTAYAPTPEPVPPGQSPVGIAGGGGQGVAEPVPSVQGPVGITGGGGPGPVLPMLQYQGRLTNPSTGQPVADDTYAVTFNLYTDSSGPVVWTETKNVSVAGGLFSTLVGDITPLPQSLLNGQELWLGIKVRDDPEAIPRQTIFPVAYAMSLRPGAIINGSVSGAPILQATNSYTTGWGYGVYATSASTTGGSGVYGTSPYVAVWGNATGSTGRWGGYFQSAAPNGSGVMGVASDGAGVNYGVYGSTSSPNGYAGYFVGDVRVSGDMTVTGKVRGSNTSLPVAYGYVSSSGSLASGSPNVSSSWNSSLSRYEITISGESYFYNSYVTQVTLVSGCPYGNNVRTSSMGGQLLVLVYNTSGTLVQCDFQFVTYKP